MSRSLRIDQTPEGLGGLPAKINRPRGTAERKGASMKTIPRIGSTWWLVFLALVLVLILPMGISAQEAEEAPDDEGEVTEEADIGEESVVDEEDVVFDIPDGTETLDLPVEEEPAGEFEFQMPANFRIEDRRADEGGTLVLRWGPSPSDSATVIDPETEEEIVVSGGQYMVFHSAEGENGPWDQVDAFAADSQYIWEQPGYFGFFLSDQNHGSNEHYSFFTNTYPARGVYEYSIVSDPDNEGIVLIQAKVYDEDMTEADYAALTVYSHLKPFRGDKVELQYVPPDDPVNNAPWDNIYRVSVPLDLSELPEITKYILFTARVRGESKGVLEAQPTLGADDIKVVNSSGSETPVPDNRDPHWFRVYATPSGYSITRAAEFDITPEESTSAENARVIVDAINALYDSDPDFFISAVANPDDTITIFSDEPGDIPIRIVDPGEDSTGFSTAESFDSTNRLRTTEPVGEGELKKGAIVFRIIELPPDAWLIGSTEGKVASGNIWNTPRTNTWLWAMFICASVMFFIHRARGGATLFVRRIAGLDHVEEAIGRATEMGRPILYSTGLGFVSDIATIASLNILGQVARKVADYDSRILVPNRDPIVMSVCQEVVQGAYIDAGRPDAYNKDDVFFLTDDQFAYTAAISGIMMREKPATNFFMGMFYAESLLLAETGASTGAMQIAGTDALAQLPFFITACDYTLIGEELYAASAYLSNEPLLLGSLKGQDLSKLMFMISILIGTIWFCFAFTHLPNPEFFKQLFQVF